MKKIIIGLLMIIMCVSMIGCGVDKKIQNNKNSVTNNQNNEINNVNVEKEEQEKYKKAIEAINVDVLSSITIDNNDSIILFSTSKEDEKATIITLGVNLPSKDVYYDYFSSLEICGETAEDEDGNPANQTTLNTCWINDDRNYLLAIVRIAGEVDTTKASVKLTGKKDDLEVIKSFNNNGVSVGFEEAITKFKSENSETSSIIKLKNRHYIICRFYNSSSGSSYYFSTRTRAYILVPLEGGLKPSLTNEDVKLKTNETVENVTGVVKVNRGERLDYTSFGLQTTIEIEAKRALVEKRDANESDEVYDKIAQDINKFFENSVIEIDDGEGNINTLSLN